MMKTTLLQLLCLGASFGYLHGYRMVLAPNGTCKQKRAYVIIDVKRQECDTMGGAWNGNPGPSAWIECHIDMCDMPFEGAVSNRYAWGIDTAQTGSSSSARIYAIMPMPRRDCDNIRGDYNGNPGADDWTECHLFFKRMDGTSRDNIDSLIMSSVGGCPVKVAYGIVLAKHRECTQIDGGWNGNPGANDWIKCHLDICVSPVINCDPSDEWSPIYTCRNPSQAVFTCTFSVTNGIENGTSSGGSAGGSITQEVSMQLETKFVSYGYSVATEFNWETTHGSHTIWSKSTTRTLEIVLQPQQSVRVNQVIGRCGDYKVSTEEYATEDVF